MMNSYFHLITDFGDSAITGTFTVMAAAYLLFQKQKRAALAIILAFCIAGFLITLGKVALYSRCDIVTDAFFDLRSPSGHSAISVAVYGTFAAIIASSQAGWRRMFPRIIAIIMVILIAVSRVILGYHTVSDVIVGSAIGAITCICVWYLLVMGHPVRCRWGLFTLGALAVVVILHGLHFPAEKIISHFSAFIRQNIHKC